MKKINFIQLVCLLCIWSNLFAFKESNDDAILKYDNKEYQMSPFSLTSFSLGIQYYKYFSTLQDAIKAKLLDNDLKIIELRVEKPVYKEYISLGFEFGVNANHNNEKSNKSIWGYDYTLSVKFRLPVHLPVGDIALTNAYRFGLTTITFMNLRINDDTVIDVDKFVLGTVGKASVGIDYYINKWIGFYGEYVISIYNISVNQKGESDDITKTGINHPFSFATNGIAFGIKTTF